jgi:hypothetical protein
MRIKRADYLLALSSSPTVKSRMSRQFTEKVVNKSLMKMTSVRLTKPVQSDLVKYIEDMVDPATHLSQGVKRSSPLFYPTGKVGKQHVLCAPSKAKILHLTQLFKNINPIFI